MRYLARSWIDPDTARAWLREDVGVADITCLGMDFEGIGIANIVTRERCVVACIEEAAEVYRAAGASEIEIHRYSGSVAEPNEVILTVRGDPYALLAAWRVAQNIVSVCSGIATKARRMVEIVRKISRRTVVSVTRKTPPGLRQLFLKAAIAGGASPHRLGLYDSILIFRNHIELLGGWHNLEKTIEKLRRLFPSKLIGIEVKSIEEALKAASLGIDIVQLDKFSVEEARKAIELLRSRYPWIRIAVAGNIDEHNVAEYAALEPDEIVTSAPYYAKPIDMTTAIRRTL